MKKYQFGFCGWGLLLFFLIMVPNFIWFLVPAPHDILRQDSMTPLIDTIASICQVIMIAAITLLVRRDVQKVTMGSKWLWFCVAAILGYFICWGGYYLGYTNDFVLISLSILPCIAFLTFEVERKNWIAIIPTLAFTVLHTIYCLVNFVV
jgi:CHASE2 domain-containing sensor protein